MIRKLILCFMMIGTPTLVVAASDGKDGISKGATFVIDDLGAIVKYIDHDERVVCYVLKPRSLHYSEDVSGNKGLDGNSVGSISCIKR